MAIEVFRNSYQGRDYKVTLRWPEADDLGDDVKVLPEGLLSIEYTPHRYCLLRQSLSAYLRGFEGKDFFDKRTLKLVLSDLVNSCGPKEMAISYAPDPRGSDATVIRLTYRKPTA